MENRVEYWFCYILENLACPPNKREGKGSRLYYVGITNNIEKRVSEHNDGQNPSTSCGVWSLKVALPYRRKSEAVIVERWLKSGDTRQKREEAIRTNGDGENSERNAFKIFAFAEKWWDAKEKRKPQGRIDL